MLDLGLVHFLSEWERFRCVVGFTEDKHEESWYREDPKGFHRTLLRVHANSLTSSEHALFDDVIEAIQNTLTEKHRNTFRQYTDVPSLLEDLKTFCDRNVKDTRRLRVCLERLTVFAHTFAPFFELLSIYVALKPDWVGWYWGTVGLVFEVSPTIDMLIIAESLHAYIQAGSSYVLFLEKVTHIFENLSHVLPNYQQLYEGVKRQLHNAFDDRIYTLMSYVYADVAQLWLDIYHVFSRGSTGRLSFTYWRGSRAHMHVIYQ
jgi:hypothetical protein